MTAAVLSHAALLPQVVVGNYGLSRDEERVQFGMWAMFASSLLMSVDLRRVRPESRALLQNKRVIAINQDPLGIPGRRILNVSVLRIYFASPDPDASYKIIIVSVLMIHSAPPAT